MDWLIFCCSNNFHFFVRPILAPSENASILTATGDCTQLGQARTHGKFSQTLFVRCNNRIAFTPERCSPQSLPEPLFTIQCCATAHSNTQRQPAVSFEAHSLTHWMKWGFVATNKKTHCSFDTLAPVASPECVSLNRCTNNGEPNIWRLFGKTIPMAFVGWAASSSEWTWNGIKMQIRRVLWMQKPGDCEEADGRGASKKVLNSVCRPAGGRLDFPLAHTTNKQKLPCQWANRKWVIHFLFAARLKHPGLIRNCAHC